MYERLEKLRMELQRARKRKEDADARVKMVEEKLREAENTQVLADVNALKLTPEQVAQFLKLAATGQLPIGEAFSTRDEAPEDVLDELLDQMIDSIEEDVYDNENE